MHYLLEKLLKKREIADVSRLDKDEQQTYDNWQRILSEGEMTVDKIKEFCQNQISVIEAKWKDLDNAELKNQRLITLHTVYRSILEVINKPKTARENLEKYLRGLVEI